MSNKVSVMVAALPENSSSWDVIRNRIFLKTRRRILMIARKRLKTFCHREVLSNLPSNLSWWKIYCVRKWILHILKSFRGVMIWRETRMENVRKSGFGYGQHASTVFTRYSKRVSSIYRNIINYQITCDLSG